MGTEQSTCEVYGEDKRPGWESAQPSAYLIRCHRIALDFGPAAARRALEFFDQGSDDAPAVRALTLRA